MKRKFLIVLLICGILVCGIFFLRKCVKTADNQRHPISVSNNDVLDDTNRLKGIDLSHHNSGIRWDQLDVDFVYLKSTEGSSHVDSRFHTYRDSCLSNNIPVGAYHFFTTSSPASSQFVNFRNTVGHTTNLIPVIDIEINKNKWSRKKMNQEIQTFIDLCFDEYGVAPIIYTSDNFYTRYFRFSGLTETYLWLGDVNVKRSRLLNSHIMHQYTIGKVKGIDYPVDCNWLYLPLDSIKIPPR